MARLSDISLKTKLMIYLILLIVFISATISISSYKASEDTIKKQTSQLVSTSVEQIMKRTDLLLKNTHRAAMTLSFNKDVINLLSSSQFDRYNDYSKITQYSDYIGAFNNINMIYSMYIYDLNHMNYLTNDGKRFDIITEDDENYKIIKEIFISKQSAIPPYLWITGRKLNMSYAKNVTKDIISFFLPIWDYNYSVIGVLIINISENSLAEIYSKSSLVSSGDFIIEDKRDIIVSTIHKDEIGIRKTIVEGLIPDKIASFSKKIVGREYLVTSCTSDYLGWKYISIIPVSNLMKENIDNIRKSFLIIVLISIVFFTVFSFFFNMFFYKPVKMLINGIKTSVKNHDEIDLNITRKDEIGFIFSNFNEILKDYKGLIKEVYEQKILSKNSELKQLQSQINPHFLYNSLDTAISMIQLNVSDAAVQIIESLIKLFRLSLGKKNEITTVREMYQNIENYILIQKIRYRERLNVIYDINEDVMECKVLNLLLQPIVENSIYHGIEKKVGPGNIKIIGLKKDHRLIFVVEDDGAGISNDRMNEINKVIESFKNDPEDFFALQNINKRLKLYYGEQYGIAIESKEKEWTRVTVTLPVII